MLAVIRLRGKIGTKREIEDTLKMLRLEATNRCALVPAQPSFKGMLEKVRSYVTYGEIDMETLVALLKKRLRLRNERRVNEKNLKVLTGFDSFETLADSLLKGKVKLKQFKELQPYFRLTPPSKGFKSLKECWPEGDLGYRGKKINELLRRMI